MVTQLVISAQIEATAGILLAAGVLKLLAPFRSVANTLPGRFLIGRFRRRGWPPRRTRLSVQRVWWGWGVGEFLGGTLLLARIASMLVSWAFVVLVACGGVAVSAAWYRGLDVSCGCIGARERVGLRSIVRSLLVLAIAVAALIGHEERLSTIWVAAIPIAFAEAVVVIGPSARQDLLAAMEGASHLRAVISAYTLGRWTSERALIDSRGLVELGVDRSSFHAEFRRVDRWVTGETVNTEYRWTRQNLPTLTVVAAVRRGNSGHPWIRLVVINERLGVRELILTWSSQFGRLLSRGDFANTVAEPASGAKHRSVALPTKMRSA
jgi:hypothetical protein